MFKKSLPLLLCVLTQACVQEHTTPRYETSTHPIIHGVPADEESLFGTVALVLTAEGEQDCTGTLIAPDVAITAAHCIYDLETQRVLNTPETYHLVAGALSVSDAEPEHIYEIDTLIYHEGFLNEGPLDPLFEDIGMGQADDVGLVILSRPVDTVDVIPLLPRELTDRVLSEGETLIISGYGTRDLEGEGDSGELYLAEQLYRDRNDAEFWGGNISSYTACSDDAECPFGEVCVDFECLATDTCAGDSGGPVYAEVDGTLYLVGIVSRGVATSPTYCGEGGIYTLANFYEEWIISNAEGLYPPEAAAERRAEEQAGALPEASPSEAAPSATETTETTETTAPAEDSGCQGGQSPTLPPWALLALLFIVNLLRPRDRRSLPRPRGWAP